MPITKHLILYSTLCFVIFNHSFSYSQIKDSVLTEVDSIAVNWEKVILDEKLAYRNKVTHEFISPSEYKTLLEQSKTDTFQDKNNVLDVYSKDHWQTDKVNPYRGINLPTPFKIKFEQTTFTHPVDDEIIITSRFGKRRRGPHRGLDLDLVTGDFVRSVLPGKVRFVGYSRGHGKTVVVRHANEVETVYAHLSSYAVEVNDIISEGQLIGLGGNTGNSRGSHLHLEVRYKGICIHPEYVFKFDGSKKIRAPELWVTNGYKSTRGHSSYRKSKMTPLLTKEDAIASQNAEPRYHRVRKGDTLSHIAVKYHSNIREICNLNSISKNSTLRIGQIVKVR